MKAKPFLKWAGGKTQLIEEIADRLPQGIIGKDFTYIEPFAGGAAMLFRILNDYPNLKQAVVNDVNTDLTNSYQTIKNDVKGLTEILSDWEQAYHALVDYPEKKKAYYYNKRTLFNKRNSEKTLQTALFIFLNRTCFNGLYRVNRKNEFNVPIGSYKKPQICNTANLSAVSDLLQKVEILNGDYTNTLDYASENTLFYFDPPYKPLSKTSNFNSYAKGEFDDDEQIRLKEFCEKIDRLGHRWILSNSDVKGTDPENNFFDDLYTDFNINRVNARRSINSNPKKRGKLTELIITNAK
ncbi:MAG: DNA adenine methylase [Bacteroidota bacterium]|nr:DNA adenine methylase [Bacteroidota bacterium]